MASPTLPGRSACRNKIQKFESPHRLLCDKKFTCEKTPNTTSIQRQWWKNHERTAKRQKTAPKRPLLQMRGMNSGEVPGRKREDAKHWLWLNPRKGKGKEKTQQRKPTVTAPARMKRVKRSTRTWLSGRNSIGGIGRQMTRWEPWLRSYSTPTFILQFSFENVRTTECKQHNKITTRHSNMTLI